MEKAKKEQLLNQMITARRDWATRLPEKIGLIEQSWNHLSKKWNKNQLENLYRQVHSLAGSAGTFGFPEVGRIARDVEIEINTLILDNKKPIAQKKKALTSSLEQLRKIFEVSFHNQSAQLNISENLPLQTTPQNFTEKKLVFLVEDNVELAEELLGQLSYYGYSTQHFPTLAQFKAALKKSDPAVIIMDVKLPDGDGTEALASLQVGRSYPLAAIFIAVINDVNARLGAIRAGGEAFFLKPLDFPRLIDTLDAITAGQDPNPYRILIVEDSVSLAEYNAMVLQRAGMEVAVVTKPLQILKPLEDFRPDLVLMDLYMPDCSGVELSKLIRQQEAFVSVPIVYLSGETDIEKQLMAMSSGGDDFLSKPIQPEHLILSVSSRAKRSRILRSYMVRDSLTGLLNHTKTKEELEIAVDRAKRTHTQLSFAMIDIDHFKSVNDTYGHSTGDRIIKSLSRLLKKRLRKIDIVGRYGGEEFAVILPGTNKEIATNILNELRVSFEGIRHHYQEHVFTKTFSSGVASLNPGEDAAQLNERADQAMYQAKELGRNRVVTDEITQGKIG